MSLSCQALLAGEFITVSPEFWKARSLLTSCQDYFQTVRENLGRRTNNTCVQPELMSMSAKSFQKTLILA
ncbi:hypothetical protein Ac2012v2_001753 [Leucoagaricus gongylophorus]